jgi:hypothetical protein
MFGAAQGAAPKSPAIPIEEVDPMPDQHIPIDDDTGHVSAPHDKKHISKKNDQAVWDASACGCGPFTVEFDPNNFPFQHATFDVPKGQKKTSGPVVHGNPGDEFKYTIIGPKGKNDPRVIINN